MTNWESLLQQFDQQFASIDVDPSGNVRLPEGEYQVVVDSTLIDQTKKEGRPIWKITFKVISGDHQGRLIFHNNLLDDPDRLQYIKQDCYKLGLMIGKLSELPSKLKELLDVKVAVVLKNNGEFQNCYIQKRLDAPAGTQQQRQTAQRSSRPQPPSVNDIYGDVPPPNDNFEPPF
ncbi:DUF669 domain-containing protein [Numidum massiliense]|uniref:DUF669 domain-containing protein n=1 Tax=Numidum massiliense TaxID=1522315 RepID=UPI0006D59B42|nr:DUF669 domain-containing protein [Numidum massiliense]